MRTRNAPAIHEIMKSIFWDFSIQRAARLYARDTIINGTASPAENTNSNTPPENAVVCVPARIRIEPRTGPTQGVHPNANALPTSKELNGLPGRNHLPTPNECFWASCGNGIAPNKNNPKTIISAPPIRESKIREAPKNADPKNPTSTPNAIKIRLKPATYAMLFINIFLLRAPDESSSLPEDTPLIKPMYAGMSGNVQGARNVTSPAINAGTRSAPKSYIFHSTTP